MAFGAELKDFVSGFKTGRDIVEDSLDRKERADRYKVNDERYNTKYAHDLEREGIDDARYDTEWGHKLTREGMQDETGAQDRAIRLRELKNREDDLKLRRAQESGASAVDGMDQFLDGEPQSSLHPSSGEVGAIPDGTIQYANYGTRNLPLSSNLTAALDKVLPGLGVQAKVFSGGQSARGEGGARTGSTRHDHGDAADVFFYKDGKKLDWANPEDQPIFEEIVRRGKQAGLTGFGAGPGYMQAGSMHIGFGKPAVWGAGGDSKNAPAWLRNAYYGSKVAGMARGGLVDEEMMQGMAIPEDEASVEVASLDPGASTYQDGPQVAETALPEEGPSPMPRPDYAGADADGDKPKEKPTDDPYENGRRAARDGLINAAKMLGIQDQEAIDDPALEKQRQNYLRGYGAAPQQMMRQVMDKIDPKREMDPGERSLKAMGTVYRFYMSRGDTKQAQEAATSMLQFYRQEFNKYTALAQAAAANGDIDKAAQAAVAAYSSIPNGRDFKVNKTENGYEISVTDAKSGKEVTRKVMNPADIAAAAMQFSPASFDDELLNAAGAPSPEFKGQTPEALGAIEEGTEASVSALAEESGEADPARIKTIKHIASSIAGVQENGMGPAQASDFANALATANPNDISIKPVRGNPDLVTVGVSGQTVTMRKNALADLKGMQDAAVAKTAKDKEDAAASKEKWDRNIGNFRKAVDFFRQGGADIANQGAAADNAGQAGALIGTMVSPTPSSEPAQAIPETSATSQADSGQIIETLLSRRKVMLERAKSDPRAADMVRMIEARLKQLGYTGQ